MTAMGPWCDDLYYALSIVAFDSGPCFVLCTFNFDGKCVLYSLSQHFQYTVSRISRARVLLM